MPPLVTALSEGDLAAGALEDDNVLDQRAVLESGVDDLLCGDGLAATLALIGRDDDAGLAVLYTVAERLGREAGEDNCVDGTNTRAGEEGGDGLPGHGQVEGDGVALLDSERLENIGEGGDFLEELAVADLGAFTWLVRLPNNSGLITTGQAFMRACQWGLDVPCRGA